MSGMESLLSARLGDAFARLAGVPVDPLIQRSAHADYQANAALALARALDQSPRDVAAAALAAADLDGLAHGEISGPGFVNLTLVAEALNRFLTAMAADPRLGVPVTAAPKRVVIDYSHPNIAKEMHVGHLRSSIIGDSLVRVLEWLGHDVVRVSHIGDWGTPFGMLVERLVEIGETATVHELSVGDLDGFYKSARQRFDESPEFTERARQRVVALQSGDPESLRLWRILVAESEKYFLAVGDRLGIRLTQRDFVGESFYNDRLDDVVADLDAGGWLRESDGAACAFPAGFTGRDGEPFPMIVRRTNGGYGYQATDLATIRYRLHDLAATWLIYVVGAPQTLHLEMVYAVAREAGWLTDGSVVQHVPFGQVLGADGKKLASRAGRSVKLMDLLDEAVSRAAALVAAKSPQLSTTEHAEVAAAVGIGAVKYADLATDRVKDYVFSWERMLSYTGDTAGYLQMMHARVRSIVRQAGFWDDRGITVVEPAERTLALALLRFPDAIDATVAGLAPHKLAGYLREVAVAFSGFWDACPVLKAEDGVRESRLELTDLAGRVLATGLDLLGIAAPERM